MTQNIALKEFALDHVRHRLIAQAKSSDTAQDRTWKIHLRVQGTESGEAVCNRRFQPGDILEQAASLRYLHHLARDVILASIVFSAVLIN